MSRQHVPGTLSDPRLAEFRRQQRAAGHRVGTAEEIVWLLGQLDEATARRGWRRSISNLIRPSNSYGRDERMRDESLIRRLVLRRSDGDVYLERWGISHPKVGGVLLHRMDAPDPGVDLHDHPWWFVTIPLWGGYEEERAKCRDAPAFAGRADMVEKHYDVPPGGTGCTRGVVEVRRPFRPRVMRLDECHTITRLLRRRSWSLVICGPRRGSWGFYLPGGWMHYRNYAESERGRSRGLHAEETP